MTQIDPATPRDPLLTARQVAAELGIGVSTFWRDVGRGRWPRPYYIAKRAPRWPRSEIRALLALCPRHTADAADVDTASAGAVGMVTDNPATKR